MLVTCETQELADFSDIPRWGPIFDLVDLCLFHLDSPSPHTYTKKVEMVLFEYTLL